MNPVLLKPESEKCCQVVIGGRPRFQMTARDHSHYREQAWPEVVSSYNRLAAQFELMVIEGAGGAAEVNLRERDVVNWRVAELADAPVIIVADIDKGGALAALVGTVGLLAPEERRRVQGLVINKFRGEPALLASGLRIIEERTGVAVLGVLPYAADLDLPQEDSASLKSPARSPGGRPIRVGVVRFPRIANYTDFGTLAREPDVNLEYLEKPPISGALDVLCLPGTKSTIADLAWFRESGWDRYTAAHYLAGGSILGICGGYQMLGRVVADPQHVESPASQASGLGMLATEIVFTPEKITALVRAVHQSSGLEISGYEIHSGRVIRRGDGAPFVIRERQGCPVNEPEGALSDNGRILGTSIHGLFDEPAFRRYYLNEIRKTKGLAPLGAGVGKDAKSQQAAAYDRLADLLATNLDIAAIAQMVDLGPIGALCGR